MVSVITFTYELPLDETTVFEPEYPENLQLDLAGKERLRNSSGSIFVWMLVDGRLAGETYGIPLESYSESNGLNRLSDFERKGGIYCYSNTVLPPWRRHGFGTLLKAHWLGIAAGKGFEVVYGHARPGGSQALNTKFGATSVETFRNWAGTGEDYVLYRLTLRRLHAQSS